MRLQNLSVNERIREYVDLLHQDPNNFEANYRLGRTLLGGKDALGLGKTATARELNLNN